jgi:hypothetical protein
VITLCRTFEGFIYFQDGLGANTYFSSDAQVLGTIGDVFVALSFLLADSMIVSTTLSVPPRLLITNSYCSRRYIVSGSFGPTTSS